MEAEESRLPGITVFSGGKYAVLSILSLYETISRASPGNVLRLYRNLTDFFASGQRSADKVHG